MDSAQGKAEGRASDVVGGPTADAYDAVLEVFKRDLDLTLVEKNLRLTTAQRAQQLVNATRFVRRFRPLVRQAKG